MKAIWKNVVLAESDETLEVEGNHYFPPNTIQLPHFRHSETHTNCPWKGEASYYDIVVEGELNRDAAWYYPHPKDAAAHIRNHIAFGKGIEVIP